MMINKRLNDIHATIDYLKERISIIDVVGEVVEVEKAGNDLYKALCCFHQEKTPSLTITPSKGLYHCFGCKASGDIITFYKQNYNISTIEAIYALSEKYKISIASFERDLTLEEQKILKYQQIMLQIVDKMNQEVLSGQNAGIKRFTDRGISEDIIKEFKLGYCNNIIDIAKEVDPSYINILELDKETMYKDALIYPLFDAYGQIVGIKTRPYWDGKFVDNVGRKLPKFMGTSSKFPLHSNSSVYGFHIARRYLKGKDLIIVEGQHDVLSMHQVGFKNVVGTDGTALNEPKLKMLKEHGVRGIIVMYDGDNAGLEASIKIAEESIKNNIGIPIKIARLPDGLDPDDLVRKGDIHIIKQAITDAVYGSQFIIDEMFRNKDLNSITIKMDIIKQAMPIINNISPLEQNFIINYLSTKLNVMPYIIEDTLRFYQDKNMNILLYNIEGEKIVLGEMIRNIDFRIESMDELREEDFYLGKHRVVFALISELVRQDIDVQLDTIKMFMNNKGYKQLLNNGEYIEQLVASFGDYISARNDIIDKSIRRNLSEVSKKLQTDILDLKQKSILTIENCMDEIEKTIIRNNDKAMTAKNGAIDFMNRLHDRMKNPNQIVGIQLGENMRTLTRLINGLQNKKLITVAANQSVGKTTLVCNWLNEITITQKLPWLHFSLEMPNEDLVNKIIGIRAGVNTQKIEMGNITDEEYKAIQQATMEYYEGGLILVDDKVTMESISNTIRKYIRTHNIRGVSIDYIQLMMVERNKNKQRYEELGDISGALKNEIAKKLNIPVVILSQLNKNAMQASIAKAEDGAGSYKIAQDSDVYITLKEKTPEEIEDQGGIEKGNLVLNLDKNRSGRADVLLDIYFQKDIQRMLEVY